MTKLASGLPSGDGNGLDALAPDLIREPRRIRAVIALIDCSKTNRNNDTGVQEATARVRRIEAVVEDDLRYAHAMIRRSLDVRLGLEQLPFELEEDVRAAFDGIE